MTPPLSSSQGQHVEPDVFHSVLVEPSFLETARLRLTSWVERVNEEFERERDFIDVDRMRLRPLGDVFFDNNDDQFDDVISLDFDDKDEKYDDETRSTGTADTDEDFHESSDLSSSLKSETDSSSFTEDDLSSWNNLRMERLRSRFQPFLSPEEDNGDDPFESFAKTWRINVSYEEADVRFSIHEEGRPAVMTVYGNEIHNAIQGLMIEPKNCVETTFAVFSGQHQEPLLLNGETILPKLCDLLKQSPKQTASVPNRLEGILSLLALNS